MEEKISDIKSSTRSAKIPVVLLSVACGILAVALAISLFYIHREKNRTATAMAKVEKQQQIIDEDMISIELLKQRSQQYSVGVPFLQSFYGQCDAARF